MHFRVAVDLGSRRLQYLGFDALGEPEHIDRAVYAGFGGLHWIELIMNRRRWARQIVDLVGLNVERERDVVPHQFEARVIHEMRDIRLGASEEIVDAQHVVSGGKQTLAKV